MFENACYIKVIADPRYWEDACLNGREDTDGNIPHRNGDTWCPIINLHTGEIMGWPEGIEAKIHYKVCDAGEYWLLDYYFAPIGKYSSHYVPDILCVGENGYGDYIIMNITSYGFIENWQSTNFCFSRWDLV